MCVTAPTVTATATKLKSTSLLARVPVFKGGAVVCGREWKRYRASNLFLPIFTDRKESIMSDTKSHMACEHHHLAAARHVAAAYHHLQAVAQHDKNSLNEAKTHAESAKRESGAAHQHSTTAAEQSHK
jgi:hypothetical protein